MKQCYRSKSDPKDNMETYIDNELLCIFMYGLNLHQKY